MNILWWITGFFINASEFYILNNFMSTVFNKKASKKKFLIPAYLIASIMLLIINSLQLNYIDIISSIIIILTILIIFFDGTILSKICNIIIFLVPAVTSEIIVKLIFSSFFNFFSPLLYITINSLSVLFSFIIIKAYLFIMYNKSYNRQYRKWLLFYLLIPLSNAIIILSTQIHFSSQSYKNNSLLLFFIFICVLFSNTAGFYFFEKLLERSEEIKHQNLINQKTELENKYYNELYEKNKTQAFLIHDINHHLGIIRDLAYANETSEVLAYISDIVKKYNTLSLKEYTNNHILNIILSERYKIAKQKNICFEIKIHPCDCSFISAYNTCCIFSNTLDNALESADKCQNNKFVHIQIGPFNPFFISINITNSCIGKPLLNSNNTLLSTKTNKEMHGFGLEHVQSVIDSIGGAFDWFYENNQFHISILLNIINKSDEIES